MYVRESLSHRCSFSCNARNSFSRFAIMSTEKSPRRWFSFSLRTLFVVITVGCVAIAWFIYQLDWIQRRHSAFQWSPVLVAGRGATQAPWTLRLFGEEGSLEIVTMHPEGSPEIATLKALFPEASVYPRGNWPEQAASHSISRQNR